MRELLLHCYKAHHDKRAGKRKVAALLGPGVEAEQSVLDLTLRLNLAISKEAAQAFRDRVWAMDEPNAQANSSKPSHPASPTTRRAKGKRRSVIPLGADGAVLGGAERGAAAKGRAIALGAPASPAEARIGSDRIGSEALADTGGTVEFRHVVRLYRLCVASEQVRMLYDLP